MHTLCCVLLRTQAQVARVNAQRASCFCQDYCYDYGLPVIQYFYYLTGCLSNCHFDYNTSHTVVDIQFPPVNMLLSIPQMAPRWLYMVMFFLLQLTQLSSQLSTKISTIKNFQISYIYNENRTTFATFSLVTSPTLVPSE